MLFYYSKLGLNNFNQCFHRIFDQKTSPHHDTTNLPGQHVPKDSSQGQPCQILYSKAFKLLACHSTSQQWEDS